MLLKLGIVGRALGLQGFFFVSGRDDSKEFLLKDLMGRRVIDSDGVIVGDVEDVVPMPASINIVVAKLDKSADVDIPMISDYIDMSFQRGGKELKLVVPASTFEEIWNPRIKK